MVGPRIKKRLAELEMTQRELSRRTGIPPGHLSLICNDKLGDRIQFKTVRRLSEALGVPLAFFVEDEG